MATLAVDSQCVLGECILWCEQRQHLYWVDIERATLWRHDPTSGATRNWKVPDRLGCIGLGTDGRLLLGLAKGLYTIDLEAAVGMEVLTPDLLMEVEPTTGADTRLNDGRADRNGNFVFGTKSERSDAAPIGQFYQYSARHGLRTLALTYAVIPNSICFNANGTKMYFCDSVDPRILCCDYNAENAAVSNVQVFVRMDHANASPDGSVVDSQDHLWNAQWGAGRVVRYAPDGSISQNVKVPVSQPSCCTIGGPDGDQLYITSASIDLSSTDLERMPTAGGVFVATLREPLARLEDRILLP
jgi:L-arabinonolactonase